MKGFKIISTVLSLGILVLFVGCSNKSTNNTSTEGNYSNEDFVYAKADADTTVAEMNVDDQEVRDWMIWNPDPGSIDSVSYDSTSGWHLRARIFDGEHMQSAVIDSFRFTTLDSLYQFRHDSITNIFERRLKKSFMHTIRPDSMGTHWLRTRERNMHWEGLADTVTTLNGDIQRQWEGQTEFRAFTRTVDGTFNAIKFYTSDLDNGHPTYPISGTFNATMVQDAQGPMRQIHLEGTLTVIFRMENGQHCYHARLVRGDNWWEWDHCFPDTL
jgi:hypothetical protein